MSNWKYLYPAIYRGQQIFKVVYASTNREAAERLGVSLHLLRNYGGKQNSNLVTNIVFAFMDSGEIIFSAGRKDLNCKILTIKEMEKIIDDYLEIKYLKK